ncbi:hypothetical protein LPB41_29965 [Thalassospira sp. MA62]|nr:hypothetical protein [Thalassospira sp. MA62]
MTQENSQMSQSPAKKRGKFPLIAGGLIAAILVAGYFVAQDQIASHAEDEISGFLYDYNLVGAIRYRDLDASVFGPSVTLRNIRVELGDIEGTIEALSISNFDMDERSGHLRSINLSLEGTDFPITPGPIEFLRRVPETPKPYLIGVDTIKGSFDLEYQYDNVNGDLQAAVNFEVPTLVAGNVSFDAGNIHLPPMTDMGSQRFAIMETIIGNAQSGNLDTLSLGLTDLGLGDKISEYLSVENGAAVDGASYRQQLHQMLTARIENAPPRDALESHVADIAKSAVRSAGGTLSITYEPDSPTSFEGIAGIIFTLIRGGFRSIDRQAALYRYDLEELFETDVLQIEFDS